MSYALAIAFLASVPAAMLLAVARGVPVLHVLLPVPPDAAPRANWVGSSVLAITGVAWLTAEPWYRSPWFDAAVVVGILYFWWCVAWRLRNDGRT